MQDFSTQDWSWIIDVIFGAVFGLGFKQLDESVTRLSSESVKKAVIHILSSAGFLIFVFYYVSAYHLLIALFPYTLSPYSALRLFFDLVMLFQTMAILTRAFSLHPEKSTLGILIAMTVWHIGASFWHLVSMMEYEQEIAFVVFIPHYLFILIYWSVWGIWIFISKLAKFSEDVYSRGWLYLLSLTAFCVAVYRYVQLFQAYG
jgi:hypothetical protein